MREHPQAAEDYTGMCLVMAWVNLLWIMAVVWAWKGFLAALLLAVAVHYAITWLDLRKARKRS